MSLIASTGILLDGVLKSKNNTDGNLNRATSWCYQVDNFIHIAMGLNSW